MKFKYLFTQQAVTTQTPALSHPISFPVYFVGTFAMVTIVFNAIVPISKGTGNILYFQTREQIYFYCNFYFSLEALCASLQPD